MSLAYKIFDNISEADLNELIEARVPEGLAIEYKREPYGERDADKKEALKDISSFANTAGGDLIIGMDETGGIPTALTGLHNTNLDRIISRLESLVRDGIEPRIFGTRMRPIELTSGGAAIVIRIPRSWNPPHRVSTGGMNRFYIRNSAGVHEASVEERRVLFTLAADVYQRINEFRDTRISKIKANRGPIPLTGTGRTIIHLIPLSAFGQKKQVDFDIIHKRNDIFHPICADEINSSFNLDGFIRFESGRECRSYTQVFRNGIVEAVVSDIVYHQNGLLLFNETNAKYIISSIKIYLNNLNNIDTPTPIVVMANFQGIKGVLFKTAHFGRPGYQTRALPDIDPLILPDVVFDNYKSPEDIAIAMRPVLDTLWNAVGFPRCTYYNEMGIWKPS